MAFRIRNLIIVVIFFSSIYSWSIAQESIQPRIKLSFNVYAIRPIKGLNYGVFNEENSIISSTPIKFRAGGRSKDYTYNGPKQITFFTEEPAPTIENPLAVTRKEKASVTIPEGIKEAVLVFLSKKSSEQEAEGNDYRIIVINDDQQSLPWGNILVFNGTNATLKGNIGKDSSDVMEIFPGQNPPVRITPSGQVKLAFKFRDQFWQLVYSEQFSCSKNERMILMMFPPRTEGARQLRGGLIKDYRPLNENEISQEG